MVFHINSRIAKLGTFINSRDRINTRYTRLENPASEDIEMKGISQHSTKDTAPLLPGSEFDSPLSNPPTPSYINHPLEDTIQDPSTGTLHEDIDDSQHFNTSSSSTSTSTSTEPTPQVETPSVVNTDSIVDQGLRGRSQVQTRNPIIAAEAVGAAASASINQGISMAANNNDSRIMGEYNYRMSGQNGYYLGMREQAQMIASARQSALNNNVAQNKLAFTFGGVAGGLAAYFLQRSRYEKGGRDAYLKDYNFKTLNLGDGTRIDPRDHETSTSFDDNVARDPNAHTSSAATISSSSQTDTPSGRSMSTQTDIIPGMSSGASVSGNFRHVSPTPVLQTSTGSQTEATYHGIFSYQNNNNMDTATFNNYPPLLPNSNA